jgi:hypothetical protein
MLIAVILSFIAIVIVTFWVLSYIRANPKAFSKENINQSIFVLGIVALILIGIVAFLFFILQDVF